MMEMNTSVWLIREDKSKVLQLLQIQYGIVLHPQSGATWGQYRYGISAATDKDPLLLVYSRNGGTVIYSSLDKLAPFDPEASEARILQSFPGETASLRLAPPFGHRYFRNVGKDDTARFAPDPQFVRRLPQLSSRAPTEQIFDEGILPLIDRYLGGSDAEDSVEIYTVQLRPEVRQAITAVHELNMQGTVKDGYVALAELYRRQKALLAVSPDYYGDKLEERQRQIPDLISYLKETLWSCAYIWEMSEISAERARQQESLRLEFSALWARSGADIQHEDFGEIYQRIEELLEVQAAPEPYDRFDELIWLMRDMTGIGYVAPPEGADKSPSPSMQRQAVVSLLDYGEQWRSGVFHQPRNFKMQLRALAKDLAVADIRIDARPWWQLWP